VSGVRYDRPPLAGRGLLLDEDRIAFDALVIATGVRPRCLPGDRLAGAHTVSPARRMHRTSRTAHGFSDEFRSPDWSNHETTERGGPLWTCTA
jgi:NADPH-dependent 2,4-dienoyl-CoA reductase/sulfur reductase-like enzyme